MRVRPATFLLATTALWVASVATGCPRHAPEVEEALELPEPFSADEAPTPVDEEAPSSTAPPSAAPMAAAPRVIGPLQIYFLDVGQGDAILVVGPERSLLIDVGEQVHGKTENFRKVATAIGTAVGKTRVDYMIVSHYHYDHMGGPRYRNGLWGLLDLGVRIGTLIDRGEYFVGPSTLTGPGNGYLADVGRWVEDGLVGKRVTATLGTGQINLGAGIEVEVVAVNGNGSLETESPAKLERCPVSENDYSIAVVVRYGAFEAFLGGDVGGVNTDRYFGPKCMSYHDVETLIAGRVGNVEVLKANHHGSAHSSNPVFIATVRPEVTIVSSGGYYHHPGREVVDRLSPWGPILVTHAVSLKEWPDGVPPATNILGDIRVDVETGGARYWINSEPYSSFDDEAEARGDDHPGRPGPPAISMR